MRLTTAAAGLLLAATTATADLKINNWCNNDVYFYQSTDGSCDKGPNGICRGAAGAAPYHIPASHGAGNIFSFNWIKGPSGTSIKIGRTPDVSPILQLEYDFSDQLYFDLSNLDGAGAGRTGTPFANDNVKVSPTGIGANLGSCTQVKCVAGQVCKRAYQSSGDPDTLVCPLNAGDMYLDLCEPTAQFNSRKRETHGRHARKHLTALARSELEG